MVNKLKQTHDLFRSNRDKKYCMHNLVEIFGMERGNASKQLSYLAKKNAIRLSGHDKCKFSNRIHSLYSYKSGMKFNGAHKTARISNQIVNHFKVAHSNGATVLTIKGSAEVSVYKNKTVVTVNN